MPKISGKTTKNTENQRKKGFSYINPLLNPPLNTDRNEKLRVFEKISTKSFKEFRLI